MKNLPVPKRPYQLYRYVQKDQKPSTTNKRLFITIFSLAGYRTLHDILAGVCKSKQRGWERGTPARLVSRPTSADAHGATPARELNGRNESVTCCLELRLRYSDEFYVLVIWMQVFRVRGKRVFFMYICYNLVFM